MSNLPAQKKLWEQWPDETDTAFHRFSVYLELGPERSLDKTRQKLAKSSGYKRQLQTWSSKYDWVTRSREYDKHILKQSLKNKEDILDHGRARLLEKVDHALDVLFEILDMPNYSPSFQATSNVNQRIKVAESILDRAGLVAPDGQIEPGKNVDDATYIQNIYNRIENHYGDGLKNDEE